MIRAIAACMMSRPSSIPISMARRVSSRSSAETDDTAHAAGNSLAKSGRKYSVLSSARPAKRMRWATPAGAQIAQRGGATQEPASVHTVITPDAQ